MTAIAMRMRTHKGLTAIQQGIALLRRLGDRASVVGVGTPSSQMIDMPVGSYFVPSSYDNTLNQANGGFYTNVGTAGQTRACLKLDCIVGQQYTLSFTNASAIAINAFIREGSDGFGTIIQSATLPTGATSITWVATSTSMVMLWNFNPPQAITITNVRLQWLRYSPFIQGSSITPTSGVQSIGPELVSNGDFANGTAGWTLWQPTAGVVQLESGGMRIRTTDATFAAIQPALALSPGSTYQVTFTVRNWVNGSVQVSIDGTTAAFTSPAAAGTYTFPVVASGSCVVQIKRTGGANCDLIVDDVSCKLVTTSPLAEWLSAYVESSANTFAAVDGPVGFLSDGSGTIGPELAPQSLLNWSTYNTPINVTDMSAAADAAADGLFFSGLVVGQQYQLSFAGSSTGSFNLQQYGGSTIYQAGLGTSVFTAQEPRFLLRFSGAGTVTFTKMSVRAITGRHATQATGANKPTLRRGLYNLLPYSGDFTNAAWTKGSGVGLLTPGIADPFGGTAATRVTPIQGAGSYLAQNITLQNSVTYTRVAIVKPETDNIVAMEFVDNGSYTNTIFNTTTLAVTGTATSGASITPIGGGWFICLRTWTTGATGTQAAAAWYTNNYGAATSTNTMIIHRLGTLLGSVTAQQILQCGGIPLTTSAAASGLAGNFKLNYAIGGTQSLALQSAPFSVTDDHVVIQGVTVGDAAGTHASFAMASGNSRFPVLYVSAGGYPAVSWRDDTGVGVTITAGQVSNGDSFVFTGRKVGSLGYARKNGVPYQVAITGLGTTTATAAFIGASTAGTINWVGDIYPTVIVKGSISDAELLVLERFVGALTGPTGVKF